MNKKEKEKGKISFLKGILENILIAPKKWCTQYTQCIQYALKGKLKQKKKKKQKQKQKKCSLLTWKVKTVSYTE